MICADFDYVRTLMRDQAGIVLEGSKEYFVESRLQTLAQRENVETVDDLVAALRADPPGELRRKVLDAILLEDTAFFRDLSVFEALRGRILPELIQVRQDERVLCIWCGAASSGQEPFSVLITLAEHFPAVLDWDLTFLATDLRRPALAQAAAGRFSQLEINRGVPPTLLMKYFARQDAEWEFHPELRRRIDFREVNLVSPWPDLPPLDLVLLRNVLGHFDAETRHSVLACVRKRLRPGGYLLLGAKENVSDLADGFEMVGSGKATFYRVKSA